MSQQLSSRITKVIPPDLFLCNPENRGFVEGHSHHVRFSGDWIFPILKIVPSFVVLSFGIAFTGVAFWWLPQIPVLVVSGLILCGLCAFLVWRYTDDYNLRRRLLREGQLLTGEVVACSWTWTEPEEGPNCYTVPLEYAFYNPIGRKISGNTTFYVRDKTWSGPAPGIPVVVMYANDKNYRLL
jgi:hypothetical protein